MAQLLNVKDSANVHLNTTFRHMRLCRQIKGGDKYAVRIEAFYNELLEKQKTTEQAMLDRKTAYDDVVLIDTDLDNPIRTLHEKSKQYDRDNPGRPVLNQLFPDITLSDIIYASYTEEPDKAEQLLSRLNALEDGHPLKENREIIRTNIDRCRAALAAQEQANAAYKAARSVEEISKANLRRQYEFNYLDMVKEFGKAYANRFFPVLNSKPKKGSSAANNSETSED